MSRMVFLFGILEFTSISAATLAAVFNFVPVLLPLLAPRERTVANRAHLLFLHERITQEEE